MNPLRQHVARFISTFVVASAALVAATALAAWSGPPAGTPPNNCTTGYPGCDAPLNVGATTQTKVGALWLDNLYLTRDSSASTLTYLGFETGGANYAYISSVGSAYPTVAQRNYLTIGNYMNGAIGNGGYIQFQPNTSKIVVAPPNAGTVDISAGKLEATTYCFNNDTNCITGSWPGAGGGIQTAAFSVLLPNGSQRIAFNHASLQEYCDWKGYDGYTGASRFFESEDAIYTWNGSAWVYSGNGAGITYIVCFRNL